MILALAVMTAEQRHIFSPAEWLWTTSLWGSRKQGSKERPLLLVPSVLLRRLDLGFIWERQRPWDSFRKPWESHCRLQSTRECLPLSLS
jgi:hypothetical protein